jgi:amino acid adenylation domain-containing protein
MAHYLIEQKHVKADTLVGICAQRSFEMVIGILAILKAGAAYVPIDPNYPDARISHILADAMLDTVLIHRQLQACTPVTQAQSVYLDDESLKQQLSHYPVNNIDTSLLGLQSSHRAIVIYTSGSTGQPKGVCIPHTSWCAYAASILTVYEPCPADIVMQFSSIAFDLLMEEMTTSLFYGGTLVLPTFKLVPSISQFWQLIDTHQITLAPLPTAYWHQLCLNDDLSQYAKNTSIRLVVVGGSALGAAHLDAWQQQVGSQIKLINTYGPTETTVISSYFDASEFTLTAGSVPIGQATADSHLMILDQHLSVVPQGVSGELYIGGSCLADGYLNQEELTAQQFIANPYYDENDATSSKRLYKTGDLVRCLSDDNLVFLGRIDHQVKISGFRVELGEIEHVLASQERVKDAVVLAKESTSGDLYLAAYVVTNDLDETDSAQLEKGPSQTEYTRLLKQSLSQLLPEYMIPKAFVLLESLPLNTNGKVDRKALPEPDMLLHHAQYVPPVSAAEKLLCEVCAKVLDKPVKTIGIDDDFFALGGNSLIAVRLVALLKQTCGIELPLQAIFVSTNLAQLAYIVLKHQVYLLEDEQDFEDLLAALPEAIAQQLVADLEVEADE